MSHARPRIAAPLLAALATSALLVLTGCSGGDASSADNRSGAAAGSGAGSGTTIAPGGPGDEPSTVTGGSGRSAGSESFNHADIAFVQMMVPHHAQAIEMSELAESRAADPAVRRLAERIEAAQGPEILAMSAWLDDHDLDVPTSHDDPGSFDHSEHGHDPMVGMLTPAQMRALADADGAEFDRLYLAGMVAHHAGAVTMAEKVTGTGVDVRVSEIAADVATGQSAEIARMRALQG